MKPLVIVQVVNYNGLSLAGNALKQCLDSVVNQSYKNTLTHIIDNASDDGSAEWIESRYPGFKLTVLENNRGYTAHNRGLGLFRQHKAFYMLLLNNDIMLEDTFIEKMIDYMEDNQNIGISSGLMKFTDKPDHINSTGIMINRSAFTGNRDYNTPVNSPGSAAEIASVSGGCMMIRKDVINSIGLFDSFYHSYYEDTDLCIRMLTETDFEIGINECAEILHGDSASWRHYSKRKDYYILRNQYMTILKLFPLPLLAPAFIYLLRTRFLKRNFLHLKILANLSLLSPFIIIKRTIHSIKSKRDIRQFLVKTYTPFSPEKRPEEYTHISKTQPEAKLPESIIMSINDNYLGYGFGYLSSDYPKGRTVNDRAILFLSNKGKSFFMIHGEGNGALIAGDEKRKVSGQFTEYFRNNYEKGDVSVCIETEGKIKIIEAGFTDEKI